MDVVGTLIIGGGLAGLSIAEYLTNKESPNNVIVLEQYKAWGGRAVTYRDPKHDIQYEIGAGRIFHKHKRVGALVHRFGLHTYPISTTSILSDGQPNPFLPIFEPIRKLLEAQPAEKLRNYTVSELVPNELRNIFQYYPYWAEIHMLRADVALPLFAPTSTMGAHTNADYYGIKEGIDSITTHLKDAAIKAGAILKNRHKVTSVRRIKDDLFEITGLKGKKIEAKPFKYHAKRLIIATCRCGYSDFSILEKLPLMKQLATSPLMRIYAVYDPPLDIPKKIVTDSPLRYIIPINKGLIMISYTDGDDTKHWRPLEGESLENEIHKELQKLFPDMEIPTPKYLKKHDWTNGCTYWLPGDYDVNTASKIAHNPEPNLYLTGESISTNQTWLEGALESVEYLKTLI